MLVNFCDKCLRTDVICSTVCTEGYEISNLVNNSNKGFLAYSCIKPPVVIDFIFISNIQISHVIIWPQVGAQKSCGFKLSVKSSNMDSEPFIDISTAFLKKDESGVLFFQKDFSCNTPISTPTNFINHYIKAVNIINYTSTLRLNILKTQNSVPALGKIEIWGKVSPKCGKDMAMNVMALWRNRVNSLLNINTSDNLKDDDENKGEKINKKNRREQICNSLNIPEDFLDPITFEIMTQPIILPSGKIVDQKTLEKHGYSEAVWGRSVSDPFTGIRFSDAHKPIAALPLKARIDKFLLENSNQEEIKKLPRVLGSNIVKCYKNVDPITCVSTNVVNHVHDKYYRSNQLKRALSKTENNSNNSFKKHFYGHSLPVVPLQNLNSINTSTEKILHSLKILNKKEINKSNICTKETLITGTESVMSNCKCCKDAIFYKLPCEHIICRKALLLLKKTECIICKLDFKMSDPQRYHLSN